MAKRKAPGKGSAFERDICKQLSKWVTHGKRADVFWRTAMSGGRSTVAQKKGKVVRQSGDICAVSHEGVPFLSDWYVECKHYKRIDLGQWLLNNQGKIVNWWARAKKEARQHGKQPMLIIKQNTWPVLVITKCGGLVAASQFRSYTRGADVSLLSDMLKTKYWPPEKYVTGAEL